MKRISLIIIILMLLAWMNLVACEVTNGSVEGVTSTETSIESIDSTPYAIESTYSPTFSPVETPEEPLIICFDAGHFANYNRYGIKPDGTQYSEGEAVKALADELSLVIPDSVFSRPTYEDNPSFGERSEFAAENNADVMISLHSNGSPETYDESVPGIVVFHSIQQPENQVHAEKLAELLSKYSGIEISKVHTWENSDKPGTDYLGMMNTPVKFGIEYVFLVEHGSHWQFAGDYDGNLEGFTQAYIEFYEYLNNLEGLE